MFQCPHLLKEKIVTMTTRHHQGKFVLQIKFVAPVQEKMIMFVKYLQ